MDQQIFKREKHIIIGIYLKIKLIQLRCGIMISASHNPYYDNGIKLINGQGEKMEEEIIALVEDYLDDRLQLFGEKWHEIPFTKGGEIGRTVDYSAGRNRYIGYLISLGVYSFRG